MGVYRVETKAKGKKHKGSDHLLVIRGFPHVLKNAAKAQAAIQDTTFREWMIDAVIMKLTSEGKRE